MRAVIWGTGGTARDFLRKKILYEGYDIIAFTDNSPGLWGEQFWNGILVVPPCKLSELEYDMVIICSLYCQEIEKQLIDDIQINKCRIITYKDLERKTCVKIISQNAESHDEELQKSLNVFRQGILNVLGSYNPGTGNFSIVYRDDDGFPYILFENKRMYYPKAYNFQRKNGMEVVEDVLYEQGQGSPHLYVRSNDDIPDQAVIVDAGVCEGNFALRYIDKARKIYLIESDRNWMEALQKTFQDYAEKVVFCDKYLSGRDNAQEITLDSLVREQIDFLKMDIEGAEVDAVLGARTVLENSHARCAICSYHRQYDEKYISYLLESYGYTVDHSEGYMFFPYDENVADTLDFRRGVIYGIKE